MIQYRVKNFSGTYTDYGKPVPKLKLYSIGGLEYCFFRIGRKMFASTNPYYGLSNYDLENYMNDNYYDFIDKSYKAPAKPSSIMEEAGVRSRRVGNNVRVVTNNSLLFVPGTGWQLTLSRELHGLKGSRGGYLADTAVVGLGTAGGAAGASAYIRSGEEKRIAESRAKDAKGVRVINDGYGGKERLTGDTLGTQTIDERLAKYRERLSKGDVNAVRASDPTLSFSGKRAAERLKYIDILKLLYESRGMTYDPAADKNLSLSFQSQSNIVDLAAANERLDQALQANSERLNIINSRALGALETRATRNWNKTQVLDGTGQNKVSTQDLTNVSSKAAGDAANINIQTIQLNRSVDRAVTNPLTGQLTTFLEGIKAPEAPKVPSNPTGTTATSTTPKPPANEGGSIMNWAKKNPKMAMAGVAGGALIGGMALNSIMNNKKD